MGSKTIKTTEKSSGTTTPVLQPEVQSAVTNYYSTIDPFGQAIRNGTAQSYLPQTNSNLQQAFGMGSGLTQRSSAIPTAMARTEQAIGMAGQPDVRAPQIPGVTLARAPTAPGIASLGDPSQYRVDAAQIDDTGDAQAGFGSDYMGNYLDPMMDDIIGALEAEYDNDMAEQEAAMESEALMNKGFGGSGYAIQKGQFGADAIRGRNALKAGLRSDMWKTAIGAGAQDANNVTGVGLQNSANANQRALTQAQLNQQAGMYNSQVGSQYDLAEFDAENALRQMIYGTEAGMNQNNANAANQFSLADFGMQGDMARFNADKRLQENQQRLAGAGLLGELGSMDTNDTLARLSGLLNLGQTQYGVEAAQSPLALLQAYGGLLNPSGVMNVTTGQNVTGESSGTQKQSGGLGAGLLGGLFGLGSAALGNASLFK